MEAETLNSALKPGINTCFNQTLASQEELAPDGGVSSKARDQALTNFSSLSLGKSSLRSPACLVNNHGERCHFDSKRQGPVCSGMALGDSSQAFAPT